jgi:hypothetical protein
MQAATGPMSGLENRSFINQPQQRSNLMTEEYEDLLGFEGFGGALTDSIWLRLVIEDVIFEMKYSAKEITALNVAMEALTQGNVPGTFSTEYLLEACDGYLERYNDVFTDLGYVPYDLNDHNESGENDWAIAARSKSKLFKAHAAEMDAYVKAELGDYPQ